MAILILLDRISKTFHFLCYVQHHRDSMKSVHLKTKVKMTNGVSRTLLTRGKTSRSSRMRGNRNDRFESAFNYVLAVLWIDRESRDRALKTRHKERLIVSISKVGQIRSEIRQFLIHRSFLFFLMVAWETATTTAAMSAEM